MRDTDTDSVLCVLGNNARFFTRTRLPSECYDTRPGPRTTSTGEDTYAAGTERRGCSERQNGSTRRAGRPQDLTDDTATIRQSSRRVNSPSAMDTGSPRLAAEHLLCTVPWSGTPCLTTSAHSRTMSLLSRAWKPGCSLGTSVHGALEIFVTMRYINLHLPLPLPTPTRKLSALLGVLRVLLRSWWLFFSLCSSPFCLALLVTLP